MLLVLMPDEARARLILLVEAPRLAIDPREPTSPPPKGSFRCDPATALSLAEAASMGATVSVAPAESLKFSCERAARAL